MATQLTLPPQQNKAGLCPHGLSPSACPICSNKGGMSSSKSQNTNNHQTFKPKQWSWMKCYLVGMEIESQRRLKEKNKIDFQRQLEFAKQLSQNIKNLSDRIQAYINNLRATMPEFSVNIIQNVAKVILIPLNLAMKIPQLLEKIVTIEKNIQNLIANTTEKLTAILGDLKNFIDRKIIENLKQKAKKIFRFFIFNIEDENYKNDETLNVFKTRELRKFIYKFIKQINKQDKKCK